MQHHTTFDKPKCPLQEADQKAYHQDTTRNLPLHIHVEQALNTYLIDSEEQPVTDLYETLLKAIEPSLLKIALSFCKTQQEAAIMLGLSRGTLRKKLKRYHFLED